MNAQNKQQELLNLLKAKFTLLYLVTGEERRAQAAAIAVAEALKMDAYLWSITGGMLKVGDKEPAPCDDPMAALMFIQEAKGRGLFVLRDFDPFIEQGGANVANIRKLRELADELANAKKADARAIVILSPKLVLPDSLRATTVVIEWPLPDKEELRSTAEAVVSSLPADLKVELPKEPAALASLITEVSTASQGLTLIEAQNAFALSAIKHKTIKPGEVSSYKEQAVTKSGLLEWRRPKGGFDRVAGLLVMRQWLVERREGFSEEARKYRLDTPKGVLCTGVPGCGKSAMADAAAFEWGVPLLGWDVGKTFGKYQGQTEDQTRQVIATAEAVAPCILRVDEIEKGFSGMGGSGDADGGSSNRMFSTFLTWMQEKTSPVFVFATANDADKLPAELLRKGRFSEVFFVDLPNEEEREGIWRVHIGLRGRDPEKFDLAELVAVSDSMSGAEIEGTLVDAMFAAFARKEEIATQHILEAAKNTVPLNKMAPERIEKVRSWAKGRARLASAPVVAKRPASDRFSELA
jgi:hypothetical protein